MRPNASNPFLVLAEGNRRTYPQTLVLSSLRSQSTYFIGARYDIVLVGLLVNPVAGMGGSVALKGTDDDAYMKALGLGAVPISDERARRALARVTGEAEFLTASGEMGERALADLGFPCKVVHTFTGRSAAKDTHDACIQFMLEKVQIIVLCGGDGTARDVMDAVGERVAVIGIPSGVKMHSGIFANTPEEAGDVINAFLRGDVPTRSAEVMDVDEKAFREGELKARLYGYMLVPDMAGGVQPPKGTMFSTSDEEQKDIIADFIVTSMETDTLYIIGPGTTTRAVAERMAMPKTLLGVDVYRNGKVLINDVSERDLLDLLPAKAAIILTPIGRQGFIFGRGNQQISAEVVDKVGVENLRIIATSDKLRETVVLRSDSGDVDLDKRMKGYHRVLVGHAQYRMVRCM